MSPEEVGKKHGFRSGLEEDVAKQINHECGAVEYETTRVDYTIPAKKARYTPDFVLPNGIVIETKGRFLLMDRQKHLLIKAQHPELDIRFVFTNPYARIAKRSKTTYAVWCEKNGFKYAHKRIPIAWFRELPKPEEVISPPAQEPEETPKPPASETPITLPEPPAIEPPPLCDEVLSAHFTRSEFVCKCGCGHCPVQPELLDGLEKFRAIVGKPVLITSGCRCEKHNRNVGGVPRDPNKKGESGSLHMYGKAADIKVKGMTPAQMLKVAESIPEFASGGIGRYKTFLHVDIGRKRRWQG